MPQIDIVVGYTTALNPEVTIDVDEVKAPSNYKDQAKIDKYIEERVAKLQSEAALKPYTGRISRAVIFDIERNEACRWSLADDSPSVSSSVCAWLLKRFPEAWDSDDPEQTVGITGFGARDFFKMLGTECSIQRPGSTDIVRYAPVNMWYNNKNIVDMESLVGYSPTNGITWDIIINARGFEQDAQADGDENWIKTLGWREPHVDAANDVAVSLGMCAQLGILETGVSAFTELV